MLRHIYDYRDGDLRPRDIEGQGVLGGYRFFGEQTVQSHLRNYIGLSSLGVGRPKRARQKSSDLTGCLVPNFSE